MLLALSIKSVSQASATAGGVPVLQDTRVGQHSLQILIAQVTIAVEIGGKLVPPLVVKENVHKKYYNDDNWFKLI